MSFLIDTNILLRIVEPSHPMFSDTIKAIKTLKNQEKYLYIAPQNLIEFWNVSTRPSDKNGLGFTIEKTEIEINKLKSFFCLLPDSPLIYEQWQQLVIKYQVKGVNVHDTRLTAFMLVNNLTHILTFNTKDFKRYTEIIAINPQDISNIYL